MSDLIAEYYKARIAGRYDQAAARREEARRLLETFPADAPQFAGSVASVAQVYQSGGFTAQARAVLEWGLSRAERLGESHPTRFIFLNDLSNQWQQERNLLKAVAYLEKAVAAPDPASSQGMTPSLGQFRTGSLIAMIRGDFVSVDYSHFSYQRLANLFRQLGRPQEAAAIMAKARSRLK